MNTPTYRSATAWIETTLGHLSAAVEKMPAEKFLAEHAAACQEPRSAIGDLVCATLEREWQRRRREAEDGQPATKTPASRAASTKAFRASIVDL